LTEGAIYVRVCQRTKVAFGTAVHPHLFRTIAATTIVREAPEQMLIARDLLSHANVETTLRHYTQAQSVAAGRALAAAMEQRRRPRKSSN
jgi:integrase